MTDHDADGAEVLTAWEEQELVESGVIPKRKPERRFDDEQEKESSPDVPELW